MKKPLLLFLFVIALVFVALMIAFFRDIDSLEGRSWEDQSSTQWVIKNGAKVDGISNFVLMQKYDKIRNQPVLEVSAEYWAGDAKYLKFRSVKKSDYLQSSCISPIRLGRLKPVCEILGKRQFTPCLNSFIQAEKNANADVNIQYLVDNYEDVISYLESWPRSPETASINKSNSKFYPTYYDEVHYGVAPGTDGDRKCWIELSEEIPLPPETINCDSSFSNCEASDSILINRQ